MLTVDPASRSVTRNPEFYVMKHFAHFTSPGDCRIGLKGPWAGHSVAYLKPDGTKVLVLINPYPEERELRLGTASQAFAFRLAPESFHTIVIPNALR
ncbi:hypothetical protein KP806_06945 [Paenibacillus sp. N4]|uniref:glycoside hydrolase family 30 beta sandwich domain-containing protein n=1 Tax=Paenibacillus vietnamensis TaxID=2590547 RepID=UPI001CD06DBB|nr:glycoside hydrolase family 30 beta sandwich domain-containing protein [Paenibacillus vietnamensis]MCA0754783.1 hypothetical protein [Paenibacillus vietnamensis]